MIWFWILWPEKQKNWPTRWISFIKPRSYNIICQPEKIAWPRWFLIMDQQFLQTSLWVHENYLLLTLNLPSGLSCQIISSILFCITSIWLVIWDKCCWTKLFVEVNCWDSCWSRSSLLIVLWVEEHLLTVLFLLVWLLIRIFKMPSLTSRGNRSSRGSFGRIV